MWDPAVSLQLRATAQPTGHLELEVDLSQAEKRTCICTHLLNGFTGATRSGSNDFEQDTVPTGGVSG
jgi:hypothetical protein